MIHIVKGSRYDGYFENIADRIMKVMTNAEKETILRLKYETPDDVKIAGIEYYIAVIRDGIDNYSDFIKWRIENPLNGIAEWQP